MLKIKRSNDADDGFSWSCRPFFDVGQIGISIVRLFENDLSIEYEVPHDNAEHGHELCEDRMYAKPYEPRDGKRGKRCIEDEENQVEH